MATKISDSCDSIKKYLRLYRCIHIHRPLNSCYTWIYSFPIHSYYKKYYTEEKKIVYTKSTSKFFMKRNGYVGSYRLRLDLIGVFFILVELSKMNPCILSLYACMRVHFFFYLFHQLFEGLTQLANRQKSQYSRTCKTIESPDMNNIFVKN